MSESIHRLKPGDIGVIASMSDSLIVGVEMIAIIFELVMEHRGIVSIIDDQEI